MRSSRNQRMKMKSGFNRRRAVPQAKKVAVVEEDEPILVQPPKPKVTAKPPPKLVPVPKSPHPPEPVKKRRMKSRLRDRIYNGIGKDITSAVRNKTEVQLKKEKEDEELRRVDPEDIREAMRQPRPGERLYNSLVSSKKTRKKRLPKSVRKRVEQTKQILEDNPMYPDEVYNAIVQM
jgi:hypothetical protein